MEKEQSAFPQMDVTESGVCIPRGGMTLRDYFAAKASEEDIQEYLPTTMGQATGLCEKLGIKTEDLRSRARFLHADAMLKAREQK